MATSKTTVAVEINANASQAEGAVGSFKKQLKEATAELVSMSMKFGESSVEAQNAAKKVASLKDAIGDAKALADTFNPDKKFVALGGALQGATAGFSALQGAMGLFGSESDDLNKTLMKVQSAMALQQGISGIFGAIDSFKLLSAEVMGFGIVQKVVTAGQWLWNAAMAANPIGAIVAVVAALIAGIVALTSWLIKSSDAAKQNAQQIKESAKALEEQKKSAQKSAEELKRNADYTIEMMKASGKSTEEIRKAEQALAAKAVVEARTSYQVALHTREIERQRLEQMKANGATEENIKAQTENLNKYTENLNEQGKRLTTAKQDELNLIAKHNVQVAQEQTNANQKEIEANKAKHDKLLQDQKDFNEKQRQLRLQLIDENNKLTMSERDYNRLQLENEYNERIKAAGKNKELLALIEENYEIKRREIINSGFVVEKQELIKSEAVKSTIKIDASQLTNVGLQNSIQQTTEFLKTHNQIRLKLNESEMQAADAVANTLGNLSKLVGEQTTAGKIFAIAQATISTFTSAQKAYESTVGIPFVGPYLAPVNAGIAVATGIMNIKKIAAVKVPGAGGGGTPPIGGVQNTKPPQITPQAQVTRLDQGQINQIGNAASRAYVVESDVSSGQERINRLNRAARIN